MGLFVAVSDSQMPKTPSYSTLISTQIIVVIS